MEIRISIMFGNLILQRIRYAFFYSIYLQQAHNAHEFNVGLYRCSRVVRNGYNDLKTP